MLKLQIKKKTISRKTKNYVCLPPNFVVANLNNNLYFGDLITIESVWTKPTTISKTQKMWIGWKICLEFMLPLCIYYVFILNAYMVAVILYDAKTHMNV